MRREQCSIKHLKRCGTPRKKTVYGLADVSIIATILYVGSTFYPVKRFVAHMSQNIQGELKTLIRDMIIESGSYLIPINLYEFETTCDIEARQIELQIADSLQQEEHIALCDIDLIKTPYVYNTPYEILKETRPDLPMSIIDEIAVNIRSQQRQEYVDMLYENMCRIIALREMYYAK